MVAEAAPTLHLAALDYAIVALMLAAILALGFSVKLKRNTALQFIAAGRGLTLPLFVATLVSTWYGGILGVGESVSYFGIGTFVLLGVPYYAFGFIYATMLAKRVREATQISIPERLGRQYGKGAALVGAGLVFLLAVPAAHVLMLGVLTQLITGWALVPSVIVATIVGTLFLYKGGLLADARVSLLAFVMMYVGFGVIVGYCWAGHPPLATWSKLQNSSLLTWDGGSGAPYVVSFFILGAWTLIDPGFHQRAASAATPEIGRRGILISIGFWFLFDLLTISTGMYALTLMKSAAPQPLMIFPLFGDEILPAGLKAIFICGMLGTILSAMVGYSLVSGSTFGRDFWSRMVQHPDDRSITLWTRIGIGIGCVAAIGLALSIQSVVNLWYAWGGIVTGALLIPVCLSYGLFAKVRPSRTAIIASMLAAFFVSVTWLIYGIRTGNPSLEVALVTNAGGSKVVLPSNQLSSTDQEEISNSPKFSIGTLLPGMVCSMLVIGFGTIGSARRRTEEQHAR